MPTISQLPLSSSVSASDVIPISQGGSVNAVSVGTLLFSAQPVITIQSPSLLGRTSLGSGGPEQIDVGMGLALSDGTVVANGADHATYPSTSSLSLGSELVISNQGSQMLMPTEFLRGLFSAGQNVSIDSDGVISATGTTTLSQANLVGSSIGSLQVITSLAAQDLVPVSHAGGNCAVTYTNLLNGVTIDEMPSAQPAADSDMLWVAQSTNVMASQNFAAIWAWIAGKLPTHRLPIVEIATNTSLNLTLHNGCLLVCSQALTLTPFPANTGNGFQCQLVNVSSGNVILGAGFLTSSGGSNIGPQQAVTIQCFVYSAGAVVYVSMPPSPVVGVAVPGQVSQLQTSNVSTTAITIAWQQPSTGGSATSYVVQYRLSGSATWTVSPATITATNFQLSSLQPGTSYDISVAATNASGTGNASQILTVSTTAAASTSSAPNQVVGLAAAVISGSSIGLSWSGQSGSNAPTTYTVQYRTTGSSTWASSVPGVTGTSYNVASLQPGTSYDFSVYGVNASGAGATSLVVSATTMSAGNAVSSITWNLGPSGTYTHAVGTVGVNANVTPSSSAVQFGFSTSSTTRPTAWTAGILVNSNLWGAYVPTPPTAGSWYGWVEGTDGSCPTLFPTPFVVQ